MSDIEDYSNSDESDSDDDFTGVVTNNKQTKPIKISYDDDDDSDDEQHGGKDSDLEEGEIKEGDDEDAEDEVEDDDDESIDEGVNKDSDDEEEDEEEQPLEKKAAKSVKSKATTKPKKVINLPVDSDEDDDDELDENYLQKFDSEVTKNYIREFHPECFVNNYEEISHLTKVVRNKDNIIIDPLHKTIPFLTKYERARVLGQRAKQIEAGSKPLVRVPENVVDSNIIAELELQQKRIPFIIRRPIPNGGCEYWNLRDLEMVSF